MNELIMRKLAELVRQTGQVTFAEIVEDLKAEELAEVSVGITQGSDAPGTLRKSEMQMDLDLPPQHWALGSGRARGPVPT